MIFLLKNLRLSTAGLPADFLPLLPAAAAAELSLPEGMIRRCELLHSAVDSRRGVPALVLTVALTLPDDAPFRPQLEPITAEDAAALFHCELPIPENSRLRNPLVIGTGPAGIAGAYMLALAGCEPIILDRGCPVEKRVTDQQEFLRTRKLDPDSNLLIGEGGAGTFSDGKLYTGTKDIRARFLKQLWVECGAPRRILWESRGHIGSDMLIPVTAALRKKIEALGGKFIFNACVKDILISGGRCCGVELASGEKIYAEALLLAPGLGGRELIASVCKKIPWEFKQFQTGCRIEHPQSMVDRAMYHQLTRPEALGSAEYHLVSRRGSRHVSSFCMCPGGTVVNATAWEGHSISNGMSCFARDGKFANSCLIATFDPAEFGSAENFFALFDRLERNIFNSGGGDYTLPAQDASAFLSGRPELRNRLSSCETGIVPARLDELILPELRDALKMALKELDRKLPGFIARGKLIGAESFVSSPVRLCRDREKLTSIPGLYPAGEGCGAAGGIVSAACDGLRCAEAMLKNG